MRFNSNTLGKRLFQAACAAAAIGPLASQAQTTPACGLEVKVAVLAQLEAIAKLPESQQAEAEAGLYAQYKGCAQEPAPPAPFFTAARQCGAAVNYRGSLFYEEMSCCGYDPQRRTFACPVRIKQNFGFGGSPLPGSREFVLNCVFDAATNAFQPVGGDSVHLSNSAAAPSWQFAVVANAHQNLYLVQPMDGATRRARSILSWGFRPTNCNYQPIWGNWLDYRIRLDQ
jgi:hypothetical protein